MSAMGEYLAFSRAARELAEKLARTVDAQEIERIKKEIEWYETEAEFCWNAAKE
jgi:hypothetical protein